MEPIERPEPLIPGPRRRTRSATEPDWICDGAYLDEIGRTWLCERTKHGTTQRHQSSVYLEAVGAPGTVGWSHRLEWQGQW